MKYATHNLFDPIEQVNHFTHCNTSSGAQATACVSSFRWVYMSRNDGKGEL